MRGTGARWSKLPIGEDRMQQEVGLTVSRFEIVFAPDGDALVCFVGRSRVEQDADACIQGSDLVVSRGGLPPLRFTGLTERDLDRLAKAPHIYVNRSFDLRDDEVSRVRLAAVQQGSK